MQCWGLCISGANSPSLIADKGQQGSTGRTEMHDEIASHRLGNAKFPWVRSRICRFGAQRLVVVKTAPNSSFTVEQTPWTDLPPSRSCRGQPRDLRCAGLGGVRDRGGAVQEDSFPETGLGCPSAVSSGPVKQVKLRSSSAVRLRGP